MALTVRKFIKHLAIAFATLIVLLAIAIGLLPDALKWGIQYWLAQQKLDSQIENIELQLFDGRLAVTNLVVKKGQYQTFKIGSLVIHLDPGAIFRKKIAIQQFSLDEFDLRIEQQQGQPLVFAGIRLPTTVDSAPAKPPPPAIPDRHWQLEIHNIDLARLRSCLQATNATSQELCTSLHRFKWRGQLDLTLSSDTKALLNSLKANVSLNLQGLQLQDRTHASKLASLDRFSLQNLSIQGQDNIHIETIALKGLAALQRPATTNKTDDFVLSSQAIDFMGLTILNQQQLSLNHIAAHGLKLILQRDKDNQLQVSKMLKSYLPASATPSPAGEQAAPATPTADMALNLSEFSLGDNSSLQFVDKAAKPLSKIQLHDINVSLQKVDNSRPQARSPLTVNFLLGEHGQVQLQGDVMVFAERPTLKLEGEVKGIDISAFNSYAQQAIHHYVKSGHLDARTTINLQQGQLDATTQLTLHKFYVEPLSGKDAEQYQQQLGLPLGTALSLLRNRDDSIDLKLPITGDIQAPDFSLNDIVGKVSSKAVKTAVINYYSPLGMLSLASNLLEMATALRFEPIRFNISEASLDDTAFAQLDKLALLLTQRPQLHLVICGISTQADRLAWYADDFATSINDEGEEVTSLPELSKRQLKRLDKLAIQRGQVVKEFLLKEKGIDASRLILCTPRHQPGDTQSPRAELQL